MGTRNRQGKDGTYRPHSAGGSRSTTGRSIHGQCVHPPWERRWQRRPSPETRNEKGPQGQNGRGCHHRWGGHGSAVFCGGSRGSSHWFLRHQSIVPVGRAQAATKVGTEPPKYVCVLRSCGGSAGGRLVGVKPSPTKQAIYT